MKQIIVLSDKPELKISLDEVGIEIMDVSQPKNSGLFSFNDIKSIELNPKNTDWFITILSWIVDFFTASGSGDNYKNSSNLKLETVNQTLKIWLTNENLKEAESITKLIKDKISQS